MNITVNGQEENFDGENLTVKDVIEKTLGKELTAEGTASDGTQLGIAVALGDTVVQRSRWASTSLTGGENLEIITAVQGG